MSKPADSASSKPDDQPVGWVQAAGSVLAAFFGVQSGRNRQRDFSRGRPAQYIVMGLTMTALLIGLIVAAVKLALAQAGA